VALHLQAAIYGERGVGWVLFITTIVVIPAPESFIILPSMSMLNVLMLGGRATTMTVMTIRTLVNPIAAHSFIGYPATSVRRTVFTPTEKQTHSAKRPAHRQSGLSRSRTRRSNRPPRWTRPTVSAVVSSEHARNIWKTTTWIGTWWSYPRSIWTD